MKTRRIHSICFLCIIFLLSGCSYSFRDVSIDYTKTKTIKINFIENRARLINPQLSPKLTEKLLQKMTSQTKLIRTQNDDANILISGYISDYGFSTSAITSAQAATNRLTIGVHITVKMVTDLGPPKEYDVSRSFDFSANLSQQQAEDSLLEDILKGITDDIFNRIFSSW